MTTLKLQNHKYIVNHNGEEHSFETLLGALLHIKSVKEN